MAIAAGSLTPSNIVNDVSSSPAAGIDSIAPTLVDNNYLLSNTDRFVFSFSEPITRGGGRIALFEIGSTGKMLGDYLDYSSAIFGNSFTIQPASALNIDARYEVKFSQGSILDAAGNDFNYNNNLGIISSEKFFIMKTAKLDFNATPIIASDAQVLVPENISSTSLAYQCLAVDPDLNTTFKYSIVGGDDASLFNCNSATGAVTFKITPDFESPSDTGGNNIYDITIRASDGELSADKKVTVNVYDAMEGEIAGTSANDIMFGSNAFFKGGQGSDTFTGLSGLNTAVYTGTLNQYNVTTYDLKILVSDIMSGRDGTDTLISVAQVKFSDVTLVFDLTSSQDALVYQLYQAAFARTPDNGGFRYWADVADRTGMSAISLADQFLAAPEFSQKYGNPDNLGYATKMYGNVLGRTPDPGGLAYWAGQLDHGLAINQLLVEFATCPENVQLTGVHMSNGYWTV